MLNIFPGCTFGQSSSFAHWLRFLSPTDGSGNVDGITDICLHQWISVLCLPQEKKINQRDSLSAEAQPGWSEAEFILEVTGRVKERIGQMREELFEVEFIWRNVSLSLSMMIKECDWNQLFFLVQLIISSELTSYSNRAQYSETPEIKGRSKKNQITRLIQSLIPLILRHVNRQPIQITEDKW